MLFNVNYKVFLIFGQMKAFFTLALLFSVSQTAVSFGQATALDSLLQSRENAQYFRDILELSSEPATLSGTRFFDYHTGIKKTYLFNGDFQVALTIGGPRYHSGNKLKWVHALQFIPSTRVRLFQNSRLNPGAAWPVSG